MGKVFFWWVSTDSNDVFTMEDARFHAVERVYLNMADCQTLHFAFSYFPFSVSPQFIMVLVSKSKRRAFFFFS